MPEDNIQNSFRSPGDVTLSIVSLHRKAGDDGLDVRPFMVELNLFEDLFSPTMSGTILFSDSISLSSKFPLVGGELVQVEFSTPESSDDSVIRKRFIIYKLEAKVMFGNKAIYVAHIISEFAYRDNKTILSKKVSGNVVGIIKDILLKDLKITESELPLFYDKKEDTRNDVSFIIPNWSPITAINKITTLATDPDTILTDGELAGYLFFECNKGLNYWSLSSLTVIKEDSPTKKGNVYYYDRNPNRKSGMRDFLSEMKQIKELRVDLQFDMIDRMITGVYKNQVVELDIMKKTVTRLPAYDYMKSTITKMYSMNEFPISPTGSDFGNGKLNHHVTFNKAISSIDPSINPVKNRIAIGLLNSVCMEITIHGRTDISVGDQIYINMPDMTNSEPGTSSIDKVISGNYVITAIQHRLNEFKHSMILRVSTDSYRIDVT